ncbi:unnamed protein product [Moneuplotes crassus]|uniref:Peptidase M14 domain-containing protein n=1 Tax=Euplotes crassus TaxID=5936 RepID=A0AAD1UC53_EUPCR|nr:unnamed protein product [Moneuplotes crassus]
MANLTDSNFVNKNKPQVYFSGTVHGNERLGANVATYLIEYLVTNYGTDPFVTQLLRERELLITPFVNPQGYYANRREELTDIGQYYDINRDFPYNRQDGDTRCLSTVGARATVQIFRNNFIVGALTFHAGMEIIGYPWGSFNHISVSESNEITATETPDNQMFARIGGALQDQVHSSRFKDIPSGEMTDLIYPCYGSLDDWAYGSSWDTSQNSRVFECSPLTYPPFRNEDYFTDVDYIRTSLYIVEASDNKDPPSSEFGSRGDIFCHDCNSDGWIPRHLRLSLSYFDLIQPYPVYDFPEYFTDYESILLTWRLNGCLTINYMAIEYLLPGASSYHREPILQNGLGYCNWQNEQTVFEYDLPVEVPMNSEIEILFRIIFRADQDFANQEHPDPDMSQVTYINNLRLVENYSEEVHGRTISNVPRLYSVIVRRTGSGNNVNFAEIDPETNRYINQFSE